MLIRKLLPILLAFVLPAFATEKIAIIKADDVRGLNGKWDRFIKVSQEHGANPCLGIILNSLEKPDPAYETWLKKTAETGKVEFWNHGWDHKQWDDAGTQKSEFGNSGYEHQKTALEKSQAAALRVLGKPIVAFGSGFNAMDLDTARALNEVPELKLIFVYPGARPAKALQGKVLLPMALRGENDGTGKPNFAKFKEDYAKKNNVQLTFAALQFHPMGFSEQGFTDFAAILDFLKVEGWTFMLPSEYARKLPAAP
jgi:peptidoglycan/xylan/chitin deacetylase (PgdA/CDA1 family)